MEYRRLGTGGTADKTTDRNRPSLLHFNAFLESKGLGPFESLEEDELCEVDLLREFGTFLRYHARNSRSDDLLMQNSAFDYMSGFKELIFDTVSKMPQETRGRCAIVCNLFADDYLF